MIFGKLIIGIDSYSLFRLYKMNARTTAVIGISALAMLLVVGLFPVNLASGLASTNNPLKAGYCPVTWNAPNGTYTPGESVTASISADCGGKGAWAITNSSNVIVAYGLFTCPDHKYGGCGHDKVLFTYTAGLTPLTPGSYNFTADFNGQEMVHSFKTSLFTVTPEFPAGMILAVIAPLAALFGYVKLRRPSPKI